VRNANRYRLISGEQIWIVNTEDERFNPVFVLAGSDGKFARQILRNLNYPDGGRRARRVDDEAGRRVGTLVRLTPEMREPDLGRAQDSRDDETVDGDLTPAA
jgi:hypothetical protein